MRRYLLVDDNRAFAENLCEILLDHGDEATIATSGEQALKLIREQTFDALVTDMKMPVMTGAQLVQEIRRMDPGLPAVVVTAHTGEHELSDAKREGVLAVFSKPVPIQQMISVLTLARRDGLVAVVEDDVALSENLVEALRDRGFSAVTARSADEAQTLGTVRPFAALVDLHLPGSPRGEVLSLLSARFLGLPLLVITGFPDLNPALTPQQVFTKPFVTGKLLSTLEQLYEGDRQAE